MEGGQLAIVETWVTRARARFCFALLTLDLDSWRESAERAQRVGFGLGSSILG